MTTNRDKQRFSIHPNAAGYWVGKCPECDWYISANSIYVTQRAIIHQLRIHLAEVHSLPY